MTENVSQVPLESREAFEQDVRIKAASDPGFRSRLLADPRGAIKEAYGVDLPDAIELRVVEETPTTFYLVLPGKTDELTDEQLAQAAGGLAVFDVDKSSVAATGRLWPTLLCTGAGVSRGLLWRP